MYDEAEQIHQQALAENNVKKLLEGVSAYKSSIELNPDSVRANYNIASIYLFLKRQKEAVPYLKKVVALDNNGLFGSEAKDILSSMKK